MRMNPPVVPSNYTPAVQTEEFVRVLELIQHATAPTPDDGGRHEAAYELASEVLHKVYSRQLQEGPKLPCAIPDGRCQTGGACQELGQCNPHILRAPAQGQPTETWWMIEFVPGPQPRWFTGDVALGEDYFTADPNKGARFATKAGAEMAIKSMWWIPREKGQERPLGLGMDCYTATEHIWVR